MFDIINTYQYIIKLLLNECDKNKIVVDYFIKHGTQAEKDIIKNLMKC